MKEHYFYRFEYTSINIGDLSTDGYEFTDKHFLQFERYQKNNPDSGYFLVLHRRIKFLNYVGIIKLGNITIEVLPKTDNGAPEIGVWQGVLIDMFKVSHRVKGNVTTKASLNTKQHTILDVYAELFLQEVDQLIHHGLINRYNKFMGNKDYLKGKLIFKEQVIKNAIHKERFFVSHQVYTKDNVFNSILFKTINYLKELNINSLITEGSTASLLYLPACSDVNISNQLFQKLKYDRKTERYRKAMELSKIILMKLHPDFKRGEQQMIAIMIDINLLWENYIYYTIKKASINYTQIANVTYINSTNFWIGPKRKAMKLRPDILIRLQTGRNIVLDTKWKYDKETSISDVRQMFAYNCFFRSNRSYLIYPDTKNEVRKQEGYFFDFNDTDKLANSNECGLLYVNLIKNSQLNIAIGQKILESVL